MTLKGWILLALCILAIWAAGKMAHYDLIVNQGG